MQTLEYLEDRVRLLNPAHANYSPPEDLSMRIFQEDQKKQRKSKKQGCANNATYSSESV